MQPVGVRVTIREGDELLLANLTGNASKHILFSAARPGQWGDGHINCQPKQFWIDLIQESDWSFDEHATVSFTESVKSNKVIVESIPWILDNFAIFHRKYPVSACITRA